MATSKENSPARKKTPTASKATSSSKSKKTAPTRKAVATKAQKARRARIALGEARDYNDGLDIELPDGYEETLTQQSHAARHPNGCRTPQLTDDEAHPHPGLQSGDESADDSGSDRELSWETRKWPPPKPISTYEPVTWPEYEKAADEHDGDEGASEAESVRSWENYSEDGEKRRAKGFEDDIESSKGSFCAFACVWQRKFRIKSKLLLDYIVALANFVQ